MSRIPDTHERSSLTQPAFTTSCGAIFYGLVTSTASLTSWATLLEAPLRACVSWGAVTYCFCWTSAYDTYSRYEATSVPVGSCACASHRFIRRNHTPFSCMQQTASSDADKGVQSHCSKPHSIRTKSHIYAQTLQICNALAKRHSWNNSCIWHAFTLNPLEHACLVVVHTRLNQRFHTTSTYLYKHMATERWVLNASLPAMTQKPFTVM